MLIPIVAAVMGSLITFVILLCWYVIRHLRVFRKALEQSDERSNLLHQRMKSLKETSEYDLRRTRGQIEDLRNELRIQREAQITQAAQSNDFVGMGAVETSFGGMVEPRDVWTQLAEEPLG